MSGIRPPDCSKLARNPKNDDGVTIFRHDTNVNFFDNVLFLLSSLVTGPSFMSISLVLELWQFPFIRDWLELQKSEIPPSEFCPTSGRMRQVRNTKFGTNVSNKMLQHFRVTSFTVFELLNQQGGWGNTPYSYPD